MQRHTPSKHIARHIVCHHIVAIAIETHIQPDTLTAADPNHHYLSYCLAEKLPTMLEHTHA